MYILRPGVLPERLRDYGFRLGREYPDSERCICNERERDDFWLIPMNPDFPEEVYYADEEFDQPLWSIHAQPVGPLLGEALYHRFYIDCVPASTYHISNMDMEPMFHALFRMISDGIVEDNYNPEEG